MKMVTALLKIFRAVGAYADALEDMGADFNEVMGVTHFIIGEGTGMGGATGWNKPILNGKEYHEDEYRKKFEDIGMEPENIPRPTEFAIHLNIDALTSSDELSAAGVNLVAHELAHNLTHQTYVKTGGAGGDGWDFNTVTLAGIYAVNRAGVTAGQHGEGIYSDWAEASADIIASWALGKLDQIGTEVDDFVQDNLNEYN